VAEAAAHDWSILRCKNYYAAMQTNELRVVSGIHIVWAVRFSEAGNTMSKMLSVGFAPSPTWFSRLLSVIDHVLMTNAEIANRNGDLPYFGL
jgi:hypothetical protein